VLIIIEKLKQDTLTFKEYAPMKYLITKNISRNARANGWDLTIGMLDEYDHKGRQKQNGTLIAYHVASGFEFRGRNEVFIDCFYNADQSEQQFMEKYA
jgi:hypothetical protein